MRQTLSASSSAKQSVRFLRFALVLSAAWLATLNVPWMNAQSVYPHTRVRPAPRNANDLVPSSCTPTTIFPEIQVNGGSWSAVSAMTVSSGSAVNLGPQPNVGGSWTWTGPNNFTSTARQINNIPLSNGANVFVATYTNPSSCQSALMFSIGVGVGVDPGPRSGSAGAGGGFSTLNFNENLFFTQAQAIFENVDTVTGNNQGLGPGFNGNSCAQCHSQPAVGGTSPGLTSPQNPVPNPLIALATLDGATNTIPSFITAGGPTKEARFVSTNATIAGEPLDGGVHNLFTIQGRSDAPGCTLAQPNFATELNQGNVVFRIPTPLFGLGLVENTPDATLQANLAAAQSAGNPLGIFGTFNTSGNDGTITRFGWKAQNKSLLIFAGEAYNVELGVANEAFPNERNAVSGCVFNSTPEDFSNVLNPNPSSKDFNTVDGTVSDMSSDIVNFAAFSRLSAPPTPSGSSQSITNGSNDFVNIGCSLCHSPSLTTAASPFTGMSNVTYHPYSDFALHHMGDNLTDGINQGAAGPDQFRTAPLWGLGQRLFFLHDGRTPDLFTAIEAHSSPGNVCVTVNSSQQFSINLGGFFFEPDTQSTNCGSEANAVINNFNNLTSSEQQDLLNFLRSL